MKKIRISKSPIAMPLMVAIALFAVVGCNYKAEKVAGGDADSGGGAAQKVAGSVPSYASLVSSFLGNKCFTCHDGSQADDFRAYSAFKANSGGIRSHVTATGHGHMPPSGHTQLSADELSTLVAWIDNGANENAVSASAPPPASPTPAAPTPVPGPTPIVGAAPDPSVDAALKTEFAQISTTILEPKCFTCHDGSVENDLTSFELFKLMAPSIQTHITQKSFGNMPPPGKPALTADELTTLTAWLTKAKAATPPLAVKGDLIPVPSFADMKTDFLGGKCFTCHRAGGPLLDITTYELFKANAGPIRYFVMQPVTEKGHMPITTAARPHPQLTEQELSTLVAWIDDAAPENGFGENHVAVPDPTPAPVTPPPSASPTPTPAPGATPTPTPIAAPVAVLGFDKLSAQILAPKCFICHDGSGDADDYRTYSAFKDVAKNALAHINRPASARGHMPPADKPQLTSDEIVAIGAWIDGGEPEKSL